MNKPKPKGSESHKKSSFWNSTVLDYIVGGIGLLVMLSPFFEVIDTWYRIWEKEWQLSQHGITIKATYDSIQFKKECQSKKRGKTKRYKQCHRLAQREAVYWHEKDQTNYRIDVFADNYPLLNILVVGQPFLITYLPDKPGVFRYHPQHDETIFNDLMKHIQNQPAHNQPTITVEPVQLSNQGEHGFAILRINHGLLHYPWHKNPQLLNQLQQKGIANLSVFNRLNSQEAWSAKECIPYARLIQDQPKYFTLNLRNYYFPKPESQSWSIYDSPRNKHLNTQEADLPTDRDRIAAFNQVKSGDEIQLKLESCTANVTAFFQFKLPENQTLILTPYDVVKLL